LFFSKFNILIVSIFILLPLILIILKYSIWGYSYKKILPKTSYDVNIQMSANSYGDALDIKTYLPVSDSRQSIYNEVLNSSGFTHLVNQDEFGREGIWKIQNADGKYEIMYSFSVLAKAVKFNIDPLLEIEKGISPGLSRYLESTKNIQVSHPVIEQIYLDRIGKHNKTLNVLQAIFEYTHELKSKPFKGLTDAATAAKLNEASCNGKSRLFVALSGKLAYPHDWLGVLF